MVCVIFIEYFENASTSARSLSFQTNQGVNTSYIWVKCPGKKKKEMQKTRSCNLCDRSPLVTDKQDSVEERSDDFCFLSSLPPFYWQILFCRNLKTWSKLKVLTVENILLKKKTLKVLWLKQFISFIIWKGKQRINAL